MFLTIDEYKTLPFEEQLMLLCYEGSLVGIRKDNRVCFLLYQLYSFYVEIDFGYRKRRHRHFVIFADGDKLEHYLKNIDLSKLGV